MSSAAPSQWVCLRYFASTREALGMAQERWLSHAATLGELRVELQARGAELARELEITRAGVVRGLLDAFEMARADRQPSIMVSSMAAIAKLLGLYAVDTKRVELTVGQDAVQADYAAMSDAQLLALIAQGAGAA